MSFTVSIISQSIKYDTLLSKGRTKNITEQGNNNLKQLGDTEELIHFIKKMGGTDAIDLVIKIVRVATHFPR